MSYQHQYYCPVTALQDGSSVMTHSEILFMPTAAPWGALPTLAYIFNVNVEYCAQLKKGQGTT